MQRGVFTPVVATSFTATGCANAKEDGVEKHRKGARRVPERERRKKKHKKAKREGEAIFRSISSHDSRILALPSALKARKMFQATARKLVQERIAEANRKKGSLTPVSTPR